MPESTITIKGQNQVHSGFGRNTQSPQGQKSQHRRHECLALMAALDTNLLVRFLVEDDAPQLAAAKKLIRTALAAGEALFVPITVTLELEWVLRSSFKFNKEQVTTTLSSLLAAAELTFESETAAEIALALYKKGSSDFSDCMHIALAHSAGERQLWTFDRAASKVEGAKLLAQ